MKSAYELALERSGGTLNFVSDEVKSKIASLDSEMKAKLAEAELGTQQRLAHEEDAEKAEKIRDALVTELASIRDKYAKLKEKARSENA